MNRLQHLKSISSYAITFPGQGIVKNGLLEQNKQHLPIFQKYLDEVDEALNENFSKNLFFKDEEPGYFKTWFGKTSYAQPAILATSYILTKTFEELYDCKLIDNAKYLLGHSLGEYTALTLSGILDFQTALNLVRLRGELMQEMCKDRSDAYGMIALMIRPEYVDDVIKLATEDEVIGNINAPTQIVISGEQIKMEEFISKLKKINNKLLLKDIKLPVTVPFHNDILKYIVPELKDFLSKQPIGEQKVPIISNLDGEVSTDAKESIKKVLEANYQPVQWLKSITNLPVNEIYNIGPGPVLNTLNKKIDKTKQNTLIDDLNDFNNDVISK
ncbi:hypothetical protein KGF54_002217 [Candida jiufengensis]|uniref:uncharacterized protein n=1 Tax=Candida jiufengensis TaxID=497108 RepID=UPI0022245764|nr:uncharacterized protein KGF54_002217 [Candida jiufengensis]KAI5954442.1 hypothetical protein KGF54_002217 [Candida jiufengensis]